MRTLMDSLADDYNVDGHFKRKPLDCCFAVAKLYLKSVFLELYSLSSLACGSHTYGLMIAASVLDHVSAIKKKKGTGNKKTAYSSNIRHF